MKSPVATGPTAVSFGIHAFQGPLISNHLAALAALKPPKEVWFRGAFFFSEQIPTEPNHLCASIDTVAAASSLAAAQTPCRFIHLSVQDPRGFYILQWVF